MIARAEQLDAFQPPRLSVAGTRPRARAVRRAPEAEPLSLEGASRAQFVAALLDEYVAIMSCERRARHYASRAIDAHEKMHQLETWAHHLNRALDLKARLTMHVVYPRIPE